MAHFIGGNDILIRDFMRIGGVVRSFSLGDFVIVKEWLQERVLQGMGCENSIRKKFMRMASFFRTLKVTII